MISHISVYQESKLVVLGLLPELQGLKFQVPALLDGRLQLLEIHGTPLVLGAVQCTLQAIKRFLGRGEQKQRRYQQS